jgi:hypothetical protein
MQVFSKRIWHIDGEDVINVVDSFFSLIACSKKTMQKVFVPKVVNHTRLKDFRLI